MLIHKKEAENVKAFPVFLTNAVFEKIHDF